MDLHTSILDTVERMTDDLPRPIKIATLENLVEAFQNRIKELQQPISKIQSIPQE